MRILTLTGTGSAILLPSVLLVCLSCTTFRDKEVAMVGRHRISVGDVAGVMSGGGYEDNEEGAREALNYLIDFHLILMEAKGTGLDTTKAYDLQMRQAKDQLLIRKLMEAEVYDKATMTDAELRQYYEDHGGDREEVRARNILVSVPPNASDEQEAEKRKKIEEAMDHLKNGEEFAEVAKKYSEGPNAHNGGDLGFHPKGSIDPDFEKVIFSLKPGEVSDIFRTKFGFHIAKVEERRMRTFEDVRKKLKESLESQKRMKLSREYMDDVEKRANVKYADEGIKQLLSLFKEDSTGASVREKAPVLAVYDGGQWTGSEYMDFYMSLPESLRVPPKEPNDVKRAMVGRLMDAVLVTEALNKGIDKKEDFQKELGRTREDALVQLYISRRIFASQPGDDVLRPLYEENRDKFPGNFDEERDKVLRMYRDKMQEGGLETLTTPLKEKYTVKIDEKNLRLIPRALKG